MAMGLTQDKPPAAYCQAKVATEFSLNEAWAALFQKALFDHPCASCVGNDKHPLAVWIFKADVLQINGRALGVKAASPATDDTGVMSSGHLLLGLGVHRPHTAADSPALSLRCSCLWNRTYQSHAPKSRHNAIEGIHDSGPSEANLLLFLLGLLGDLAFELRQAFPHHGRIRRAGSNS
jgi:hypothetical protein